MTRLLPYMVAFVAALITLGFLFRQSRTSMPTIEFEELQDDEPEYDYMVQMQAAYCDKKEEERTRVSFGAGPGALVKGWPAKGGIYLLDDCFGIDLDFLKLDRFQETLQPSQSGPDAAAEEEAHCNRMRQLGAVWWESLQEWAMVKLREPGEPELRRGQRFVKVGWPAGGGVWVLDILMDDAMTKDTGIIFNARYMEERCRLIEQLGGVFYENPKDWLDVELP
ncbi:hypothetical protein M440DRAFT_1444353 [Trichoderma longibrachiatum ATCC 18648]|uniref:Uncharacterized protein n=1 Tax=Trichoderma longibrachiatum ATCC 18648 TaxID=983965 RepID=A0A2T4CJH6_TRILO|nr:hypothetical protein M440DRAFT_1444353 [Trichoderma longibrachiatum ATCC 18648]